MENKTEIKLGELLSHTSEIIRRNAMSILKQLQKLEGLDKQNETMVTFKQDKPNKGRQD